MTQVQPLDRDPLHHLPHLGTLIHTSVLDLHAYAEPMSTRSRHHFLPLAAIQGRCCLFAGHSVVPVQRYPADHWRTLMPYVGVRVVRLYLGQVEHAQRSANPFLPFFAYFAWLLAKLRSMRNSIVTALVRMGLDHPRMNLRE